MTEDNEDCEKQANELCEETSDKINREERETFAPPSFLCGDVRMLLQMRRERRKMEAHPMI